MRETITAPEVASMLGLSEWSVYDLARRHEIPHVRIGRRVLFRRSSLMAWLESREAASVAADLKPAGKIRRLR
ncbi:helix-turn-helix domain-containing protein [Desulfotomaculum copahuensis]|uniref:DNA-binding protein n=1 Tax=Desulfotomaculum copahuensis TaxID=1838280 RepID=A0A1B7LF09_9FIRM|nr:helix-turn-helix domain-containing protein [Desulfotomaculum copahuensis]OAT82235.1 DNA-binding protein [Desulfotomaculum copahuensis]